VSAETEAKVLTFDCETSGVDTENDRIVQLVISTANGAGEVLQTWEWIINPGVEMPDSVAEIHGLTTERLQEVGVDPEEALTEAYWVFEGNKNLLWVAYNMAFDMSILNTEFGRHLDLDWFNGSVADVQLFDPLVVDRHRDKWRKGKRTLEAAAGHYGVKFDATLAHEAGYDVEMTAKVAAKVIRKYGVATTEQQSAWYRSWATSLQSYFRRTDPEAYVDKGWPLKESKIRVTP